MKIEIKAEQPNDYKAIKKVNDLAFGQPNESQLISNLRATDAFIPELSLVAIWEDQVIGHILFSSILIENGEKAHKSLALAPMSVLPEFQKRGIGSQLVRRGLELATELGHQSVIVLGHKDYYPKFGFVPANQFGVRAPFEVEDIYFMALELVKGALDQISGTVRYPKAFDTV